MNLSNKMKGIVSLLLVFAVMVNLAVPFNITVFAAGEAATGDDIYAILYRLDESKNTNEKNIELVFQSGSTVDSSRMLIGSYNGFADADPDGTEDYTKFLTNPWKKESAGTNSSKDIVKITFKDKIAPNSMRNWFNDCQNLTWNNIVNLENLDTSNCTNFESLFKRCYKLTTADISTFDMSNAQRIDFLFHNCTGLTSARLANFDAPKCLRFNSLFYGCTKLKTVEFENINIGSTTLENTITDNYSGSGATFFDCKALESITFNNVSFSASASTKVFSLASFSAGCNNLKSVYFNNFSLTNSTGKASLKGFLSNCTSLETATLRNFNVNSGSTANDAVSCAEFFLNCSSLTDIELDDFELNTTGRVYLESFCNGCSSLEEFDFSGFNVNRPSNFAKFFMGCSSLINADLTPLASVIDSSLTSVGQQYMFSGCSSLETIDFTGLTFSFAPVVANTGIDSSMLLGCTSLRELKLPNMRSYTNYNGVNYMADLENLGHFEINNAWNNLSSDFNSRFVLPAREYWIKVAEVPGSSPGSVPVGTKLSNYELFQNVKNKKYAGVWEAESLISFKGNGGTPNNQTVAGNKGTAVTFTANDVADPSRPGYDFDGWYTEKYDGTEFRSGDIAAQWSYYAHWTEHNYNLVVDGNGGTVPDGADVNGGTISDDRKSISYSNLSYAEFLELNSGMFYKDSASVLTSWNTRVNGTGTEFYSNDSVNKLTETDGDTVTLFAQWHSPDATVTFDPQGGSAVEQKNYDLPAMFGKLNESSKTGYTFMGWYTEPNGEGNKVVNKENSLLGENEINAVTESCTLYAYWLPNPTITFDGNSGYFDETPSKTSISNVYSYGGTLGVLPVPYNGSAVLTGWYTAVSDGTKISSDTIATENTVYYAQWGYKPIIDSDGGIFTDQEMFSGYAVQSSSDYTISVLPAVKKENYTFNGWYHGDTKVNLGDPVDLSSDNLIKAKWTRNPYATVTLDPDGGTVSGSAVKVYFGHQIGELPVPTKDGFEFLGWYNGDTKYTYEDTFDSDITLTARWAEKTCTVTFNAGPGSIYKNENTISVPSGSTINCPPGANRTDYSFEGWYTEEDGEGAKLQSDTVITDDIIYYANWVKRVVKNNDLHASYYIQWSSSSDNNVTDTGDNLVFHPTTGGNISANLRVYLGTDEAAEIDVGKAKIYIPKYVFENLSGNPIINNNIENARSENFTYYETDDYYVFTNTALLNGTEAFFNINYTASPRNIKGGYIDENGDYHGDYYKNRINVKIEIDADGENEDVDYSRDLGIEVHTKVDTEVSKSRSNVLLDWNDEWGDKPVDSDKYFYVIWNLYSYNPSTCSQKYQLLWNEDTVHDGTVVYKSGAVVSKSGLESSDPWTSLADSGKNTVIVVTMHRRDEAKEIGSDSWATVKNEAVLNVKWQSGYIEQIRVAATATAYIPPETGDGPYSFSKYINDYTNQNSNYINGGQERVINGEQSNMPVLPYEITYSEAANSDSPIWHSSTGTYTVPERELVFTDGAKEDNDVRISPVMGSVERWNKWGADEEQALNDADYYFNKLFITIKEYDAVCMDGNWSNPYEHTNHSEYGSSRIYVRTAGSSGFTLYQTVKITEANTEVELPENTVGYRVVHNSSFYSTQIYIRTNLCLKASNRLISIVQDDIARERSSLIKNKSKLTVSVNGSVTRQYNSSNYSPWYSSYVLNLSDSHIYARKSCASSSKVVLDPETMTESFPVAISGWNYNTAGNKKRFRKGVFHDLLPIDFTVDKSTVFVKAITENYDDTTFTKAKISADNYDSEINDNTFSSSYYSVEFESNWQSSGRTMMIIYVNVPDSIFATGVNVFYKMKTTYSNVSANGATQTNYVSFTDQTEGQSVPSTKYETILRLDAKIKPLYQTIDDEQTAYAFANTNCTEPPIKEFGISSVIYTEGSTLTQHEKVGLNSDYTYNITYRSGVGTTVTDLVFYDVIEKRIEGLQSEWEGFFRSVDVSELKTVVSNADPNATCAPVIYYAVEKDKGSFVRDDIDYKDDFDLSKDTIWTTNLPDDPSKVTAIAVDCRKDSKGNSFVLKPDTTIGFGINMHSIKNADINDLVAYNEALIRGTLEGVESINKLTNTDVTLHYNFPEFVKYAFPESGTATHPETVVFNSVLEYKLVLTNPDEEMPINDIVLEDTFGSSLKLNNTIMVKIGNEDAIPISKTARVRPYSTEKQSDGKTKFTATIGSLEPGETITIILPVTVCAALDTEITNKAKIKTVNGVEYPGLDSNETYHIVDGVKAKILKTNANGNPLPGATLQILDSDGTPIELIENGTNIGTEFTSSTEVRHFDISEGSYTLHEVSAPNEDYNTSSDILFRIDAEGIHYINDEAVSYIKMVDEPAYKVVFHENQPNHDDEIFRIYEPSDLNADKSITHFYDIPSFADDEYVFAGWYHNSGYTGSASGLNTASNFEADKYPKRDGDYHLYAKWIKVGTVSKDSGDTNLINGQYRGFGLEGVQIREPNMTDPNYENNIKPGGMRYVASLSENLLASIDALSDQKVDGVNVEYGFVAAAENNINLFIAHYNIKDTTSYKLQYNGENVNGIDTRGNDEGSRTALNDFRYVSNINCTSNKAINGISNGTGVVAEDHRNFGEYRLYTLIITYEGESADKLDKKIDARAYIRYYDANGKLRVFYNNYKHNMYYGGCLCSFNQVSALAIPKSE